MKREPQTALGNVEEKKTRGSELLNSDPLFSQQIFYPLLLFLSQQMFHPANNQIKRHAMIRSI